MKRSPDIEQSLRNFADAFNRNDIAYIERVTSREPGVIVIGSDPHEYVRGYEQVLNVMGESLPQAGMQIQVRIAELRGYEQGDVGWAYGSATFQRGRESVEVIMTAVFVREKGDWHMVQNHASIGVPNNHTFDPLFGSIPAATG